jgi:hypothetical protein
MARFRIRTPSGQELSFASIDVFREFVRSGDLTPDDIVYDADTGEWSSARTHPLVLEIELQAEESGAGAGDREVPPHPEPAAPPEAMVEEPAEAAPSFSMADIGLELAPAPSQLSPQQETEAFMARMDAERAADLGPDEEVTIQSFTMEQAPPAPAEPPPRTQTMPSVPRLETAPRSFRQERAAPAPSRPGPAAPGRPSVVWKYAPFAILLLVLGGVGVFIGPELFGPSASEGSGAEPDPVTAPPAPAPVIAATDEAVRGRARERFLTSTQALLRGLEPISTNWLSGRYLSGPSDYAHVRATWESYLATLREVRAGDEERYRVAYERALDDAGVQGPARSERLARGIAEFRGAAGARNRHYDRVESLATVAMSGHDALLAAEGRILYEPAAGPAVSSDPVIEAVGRTPADQALLEEVLDAILAELQGEGRAGSAANVREWVYDGLLDAVTN